jgi:SAM-dependent methyltransferase
VRSSSHLFDALAPDYDAHFEVPHRRAYDELAWEFLRPLLPERGGLVVDAGCGVGRWADRLVAAGHTVIGVEQAPAMAAAARARGLARFNVLERSLEDVELPRGEAHAVLALGSLQYTREPHAMIDRFASWTHTAGLVCVLVDSLVALVIELLRAGKAAEARQRVESRRGLWRQGHLWAEYHLLDRAALESAFRRAGLVDVCAHGLLVGATVFGRQELSRRLDSDRSRQMSLERRLASEPGLANLGKQLLVHGRRPG